MQANQRTLIWLTLYAIAMAQVEASLVIYLRNLYYPDNPLKIFPITLLSHRDLTIELVRELATLIMILSVALLAVRGFTKIFAAFLYVFGVWDILYYVWLKIMVGWPVGWLEWDVLFLIPWPWLGPWIAPVLIALLFVVWGGWVLRSPAVIHFSRVTITLFILGTFMALAAFLLPAVPMLMESEQEFCQYLPGTFMWSIYLPGYVLMVVSLWRIATTAHNIGQ